MSRKPPKYEPTSLAADAMSNIGIPGYMHLDLPDEKQNDGENTKVALSDTVQQLFNFILERDCIGLLGKIGSKFCIETLTKMDDKDYIYTLEQCHIELLQALVLTVGPGKLVPTSPRNIIRIGKLLRENLKAYCEQIKQSDQQSAINQEIIYRARIHTIHYRNIFTSEEAPRIVIDILKRMDSVSYRRSGHSIAEFATALFDIFGLMEKRLQAYRERIINLLIGNPSLGIEVSKICAESSVANRAWRYGRNRFQSQSELGTAGFQLSELACASTFIFERAELETRFGYKITSKIYECAIQFGELTDESLDRFYLDNPIWSRPFILLEDRRLFLPIPSLIISFPFLIVERMIEADQRLKSAYSDARAGYLEQAVESLVREALPSAQVFTKIKWKDPFTGVSWEHDVVAILGNQLFIFEAKAGKLRSASRRGGIESLKTNFRDLFVEPGRQATRLERLLGRGKQGMEILRDGQGNAIDIDTFTPFVIHKFAVCIEHFSGLTSNRKCFIDMNILGDESDWAPILSLGEVRMLARFLDTEISFFHYLTRRSTIEYLIDFAGDEQDLLSMYLTNGFSVDTDKIDGQQIIFVNADGPVRTKIDVREDRKVVETPGIYLPPMWRLIVKDIYMSKNERRFAMLEVIMNQRPAALVKITQRVQIWKTGAGTPGEITYIHHPIGKRVFILAFVLLKSAELDARMWLEGSRQIAGDLASSVGGTDCVVLYRTRRSRSLTYEGVSFFRFQRRVKSSAEGRAEG